MVESFKWLYENTDLSQEQIEFLKNYKKPFTVLAHCPYIEMILNLEQEDFCYENKESYKKIAFRVANNEIQTKLIDETGPIFLTSANFSGEKEIYTIEEARKQFATFGKSITFLVGNENIRSLPINKPSDIFEFE